MKIYKTDNLALCAYLQMRGLKYIDLELGEGRNGKPAVYFLFDDPNEVGGDLALEYLRSEIKSYRDIYYFFRNEIDKANRRLKTLQLEEKRRKQNEKFNIDKD